MAADVEAFMHKHNLGPAVLIGHSMGAKTAMGVALRSPDLVSELISVDNAPVDALLGSSFSRYIQGMQEVERAQVHNSKQAYAIMGKYEKSLPIQQFLLANLKKTHTGVYRFRVPLDTLGRELAKVADFPWDPRQVRFEKPTLFIRGTHSY
jgi:pimeloyl-ACP methyl ester carboxylesterase